MISDISKPRILIVDDEPDNIRILSKLLKEKYKIMATVSSMEALELSASKTPPDLILLDIVMPDMDGYEVCRHLKAGKLTRNIPVIFITGRNRAEDETKGFELGAADYIAKPFNTAVVEARIKTQLELKQHQNHIEDLVKARTLDLQASESRLRSVVNAFQGFIYVCREDSFQLDFMNQALADWAGDNRTGQCHESIFGLETPCSWCPVERVYKGETVGIEVENPKNGQWYYAIHSPVFADNGSVLKRQAILIDITERKKKEDILQRENIRLKTSLKDRYRFGDIIGKSRPMQDVYKHILKAADTDANVLIYGESGTGKELVARAIHAHSERSSRKIVPVNCGAIPENLVESEFFGHKKGAFTGADRDKTGYLEEADSSSLFLDEIGEIGLNIQVKLLRAIEGSGFSPLGSREVIKPDIRIIAATNKGIKELAEKGLMREDFFYRVHIIPIYLPPLRERKEDIPLLVEHFINLHAPEKHPPVNADILEVLQNYDWPGNVRELQNTIHRYVTLKKIDLIGADLTQIRHKDEMKPFIIGTEHQSLPAAVEKLEKKLIKDALNQNQWRRDKTAEDLKINRKALYRKMKQYGLVLSKK